MGVSSEAGKKKEIYKNLKGKRMKASLKSLFKLSAFATNS